MRGHSRNDRVEQRRVRRLDPQTADRVDVEFHLRLVLGDDYPQRIDGLSDVRREVLDAVDDLRDAVGEQDVRDRRDDVPVRDPQAVERDDARVRRLGDDFGCASPRSR